MQYLTIRSGRQEWVSDGEPSASAIDAALLCEFARRVGYDWLEAADTLDNEAPDDAEAEAALTEATSYTDEQMLRALGRMIAERRLEQLRLRALWSMQTFARSLFPQVAA